VNRFLIVRLGSLGDIIHGIPVAAALRNRYPQAHIDWMVDARYLDLLDLVQCLDRRIPVDPRDAARGSQRSRLFATIRDLRQTGYDACIDLQGLVKSAILARAAGAARTIGLPRRHLREPLARLFYTDAPDPGSATHVIDKGLALLAPLGVEDRRVHFPISIPRTPAVESVIARFAPAGYIVVNPGAAWPNKRWPAERFGAVAAAIHRDVGLRSVVLWGPGEQPLAASVAAASAGAAEMAPPTTIPDVIGIARHGRLMISGDTGPLHIAGAVATPIVALFGPTLPGRNGPWSPHDITLSRVSQCSCLYERRCRKSVPCIDDIATEQVVEAVHRRLKAHG
jgi:lipopolysaccharide heptosyltransferase I